MKYNVCFCQWLLYEFFLLWLLLLTLIITFHLAGLSSDQHQEGDSVPLDTFNY